jgi:hypothetical protein
MHCTNDEVITWGRSCVCGEATEGRAAGIDQCHSAHSASRCSWRPCARQLRDGPREFPRLRRWAIADVLLEDGAAEWVVEFGLLGQDLHADVTVLGVIEAPAWCVEVAVISCLRAQQSHSRAW